MHVYAPPGPDVEDYLKKIETYNARAENPTRWVTRLYSGADYLDRCIAERAGNVAVISGNNRLKTHYITELLKAGINVLADKPMAIDSANFAELEKAFALAKQKGVLLYDIMTERFEITTMLQKEFSAIRAVFGELQQGDAAQPAVVKGKCAPLFKYISGTPIKRPAWFFDTAQYGEGLVDITTHLVDLVQWECFPGQKLDYRSDVRVQSARRWPTVMTPAQFEKVTQLKSVPDYYRTPALQKDLRDGNREVQANGEINYRLKGFHARVVVLCNFEAPEGAGDSHYSVMRGSKADLVIRQGKEQNDQPVLTIEPAPGIETAAYEAEVEEALATLQMTYPGIGLKKPRSPRVGKSPSTLATMSATKRISARSPSNSFPILQKARCPIGNSRT